MSSVEYDFFAHNKNFLSFQMDKFYKTIVNKAK